jgi:hypothetical protein
VTLRLRMNLRGFFRHSYVVDLLSRCGVAATRCTAGVGEEYLRPPLLTEPSPLQEPEVVYFPVTDALLDKLDDASVSEAGGV